MPRPLAAGIEIFKVLLLYWNSLKIVNLRIFFMLMILHWYNLLNYLHFCIIIFNFFNLQVLMIPFW